MKKIALTLILIVVIIFEIFQLKTYAVSLNAAKTNENTIDIALSTENGIVRAMSATFEIVGNVHFDHFSWADEFRNSNLKSYSYNEDTKVITIYVTPGNKSTLAIDGRIHIGKIILFRNE